MFPKALASGADIVCVELEDGIAPKDKAEARARALRLFETPQAEDGVERIVRINSMRERFGIEDVLAILASDTPPPALMMPKVRTPDEVVMLDQLLTERGHATRCTSSSKPMRGWRPPMTSPAPRTGSTRCSSAASTWPPN
jgi:(S)-citramalyl-CoA lyase